MSKTALSQRPILVHNYLNANELCSFRPSLPCGEERSLRLLTLVALVAERAS